MIEILVKGVFNNCFISVYEKYMQQTIGKSTNYDTIRGTIENRLLGVRDGEEYEILCKDITASPWEAYYNNEMIAMRPLTEI